MTATRPAVHSMRQLGRAVGWVALLVAGHAGLTAAGRSLPTPPVPWPPDGFLQWIESTDIALASFGVLRVVALVVVWYLGAVTGLVLLARLSGLRPLHVLAHFLALPWARRLVNHALGAGLAVTLAGGIVPMAGAGMAAAAPAPVATAIAGEGGTMTVTPLDEPESEITMTRLDETEAPARARPVGRSLGQATITMHQVSDTEAPATTWTIAPGDHLWHVAATTLRSQWPSDPSEAEIARYWTALIDHNRSRLAVPDDPDLVYPGQVFELPPVPAPGG